MHRSFYTHTHTGAFTQRSLYTEWLLGTEAFAHRGFYTEKSLHRVVFTRTSFYTERSLYTEELLHTEGFKYTTGLKPDILKVRRWEKGASQQGRSGEIWVHKWLVDANGIRMEIHWPLPKYRVLLIHTELDWFNHVTPFLVPTTSNNKTCCNWYANVYAHSLFHYGQECGCHFLHSAGSRNSFWSCKGHSQQGFASTIRHGLSSGEQKHRKGFTDAEIPHQPKNSLPKSSMIQVIPGS